MRKPRSLVVLALLLAACSSPGTRNPYVSFSRFTDPGEQAAMLEDLPEDIEGLCDVARRQTVHHNLLPHEGVPRETWTEMSRVWPPRMSALLSTLSENEPGNLHQPRSIEKRIVGACILESHLLAGMLRYREIPVRIRAGYFKDVRGNAEHVVAFWEHNARAKQIEKDLLEQDPDTWSEVMTGLTRKQVEVNHHIEHWICEYWDTGTRRWRLLDANVAFLRASSGLEVGFHLPREHFEYAHEAWVKMRTSADFDPDRYREWPQDGRSHIRSQLLMDFYSLLNHDVAGEDRPTGDDRRFIKEKAFEEVSPEELAELNALAELLAGDPGPEELAAFYRRSATLRIEGAERDPSSFVFDRRLSGATEPAGSSELTRAAGPGKGPPGYRARFAVSGKPPLGRVDDLQELAR